MEISESKLQANRRNAGRSTGPRTSAGKARSRFNALKHGLTAKAVVLPDLEDPKDFKRVLKGYRRQLKPKGALEKTLVQQLAASFQRTVRALRVEQGQFLALTDDEDDDDEDDDLAVDKKALKRGGLQFRNYESFGIVLRYGSASRHDFDRILKTLTEVQQLREKRERKRRTSTRRRPTEAPDTSEEAAEP
jgi:hypothetical protein